MSVKTPEFAATTLSNARSSRRSESFEAKPGNDTVINSGRSLHIAANSIPSLASFPGRKFSIMMSASAQRASTFSSPFSVLRSRFTISLLRIKVALAGLSHIGPPRGSIWITVAPRSPNSIATAGPAMYWPKSTTFTPVRGSFENDVRMWSPDVESGIEIRLLAG